MVNNAASSADRDRTTVAIQRRRRASAETQAPRPAAVSEMPWTTGPGHDESLSAKGQRNLREGFEHQRDHSLRRIE
jgi:hypothetical protein